MGFTVLVYCNDDDDDGLLVGQRQITVMKRSEQEKRSKWQSQQIKFNRQSSDGQ